MAGSPPAEGQLEAAAIWSQEFEARAAHGIAARREAHRRALESFKAANPEHWHDALRNTLNAVSAKLCHEFAGILIHEGKFDALKEPSPGSSASTPPAANCCSGWRRPQRLLRRHSRPGSLRAMLTRWSAISSTSAAPTASAISSSTTSNCSSS